MKSITQVVESLIKPYIDSHDRAAEAIIAPVETDATSASDDYTVGKQLILDNVLYDVIAPITTGDALVVNTNIKASDNVSSDIEALTKELEDEAATRSAQGAKNILPFDLDAIKALNTNGTWAGNVYTYRGVDFTVNSDGTVSATGTATGGNASIKIFAASSNYEMLGKEVILNGCPSNGSASTYRIQAYRMASADGSTGTYFDDGAGTDAFTVLNNASGTVGSFAIAVYENATVTNLLFKPMVRLASDPDATYQQYAKTNRELTAENQTLTNKVANEIATRAKVSGHNFVPNNAISSGIFSANSDGTITANGTATENVWYQVSGRFVLPKGSYKLSGMSTNPSAQWDYDIEVYNPNTSTFVANQLSKEPVDFTLSEDTEILVQIFVKNGISLSNVTFKPMIRLATDESADYEPYAMTNQQMTPYVQAISNPNLLDNPWFTVNQRGITTLSAGGDVYTVDRWMKSANTITFALDSDGTVTLTNTGTATPEWRQRIEPSFAEKYLNGKTFTLSVLKDGVVYSATDVYDYSANANLAQIDIGDAIVELRNLPTLTYRCFVRVIFKANTQNKTVSGIQAIKLELGSVSTLAQDTAPNYQQELAKCQRYFLRLTQASAGFGICNIAGRMDTLFPIPVAMRAIPTATMSGDVGFVCSDGTTKSGMESVSVWGDKPINNIGLFISKTGLTVGLVGRCYITTGAYIDLSADL